MPTPQFLQTPYRWHQRQIVKFGGLPVPVSGVTLPWIDLNDRLAYFAVEGPKIDNSHISNKASQLSLRGKGVWTAQDFVGRKIRLPVYYDETVGVPFSQAKAHLTQTGEQYLTFDNVTGLLVRTNSFAETDFLTDAPDAPGQYTHKAMLEFLSRNPFPQDMTATNYGPSTITNNYNSMAISYAGMVYAEPVYTLTFNTATTVTQFGINNTTSGEAFSVLLGAPATGVNHTLIVDCTQFTVTLDGVPLAPVGSFPLLYPGFPPPFTNTLQAKMVSSGGVSGTLNIQYFNKWEI